MYSGNSAFVRDFLFEKTASRRRDMSRAVKRKRAFKGETASQKVVNQTVDKITDSVKPSNKLKDGLKNIGSGVGNVGKSVSSFAAKHLNSAPKKIGAGALVGAGALGAGAGLLNHHLKNKQAALYMDAIEKVALYR